MNALPTNFKYLYSQPDCSAVIRSKPDDFKVNEQLGFEPEGQGEHVFLRISKRGQNTAWVARQLANFAQISLKDVSYAGKKDRHAVTEQWFCVKFPIKRQLNWNLFNTDEVSVLAACRHPRKLRLGTLKSNQFELYLRQVTQMDLLEEKVKQVQLDGVPNYFGNQRFGYGYTNLYKGIALLEGKLKERNRTKKSMYISAVRSWLFNWLLSCRIEQGLWGKILRGDALMIAGSHSCFMQPEITNEIITRFNNKELNITGMLWGRGDLLSATDAENWERTQLNDWKFLCELLEPLGLKQERRSFRLMPKDLQLERIDEQNCRLCFELPTGSFATSLLREICQTSEPDQRNYPIQD